MYEKLGQAGLLRPVADLTPAEDRNQESKALLLFMDRGAEAKIERIENLMIPSRPPENQRQIPIRIYQPRKKEGNAGSGLPVVVFIHGGGFVAGELLSVQEACCQIANTSGAIVVSVGYRLAPEYKFPSGSLTTATKRHLDGGKCGEARR